MYDVVQEWLVNNSKTLTGHMTNDNRKTIEGNIMVGLKILSLMR